MPKVLIVDDSAVDRRLVGGLLEKELGWEVTLAGDGADALSRIQQSPVDVVVTDLQMPEMDGLNLVQAIRVQYADLPVILITGQGSESLAVEALEHGAAGYVPKSEVAAMLPATVEDVWEMVGADRSFASLIDCMKHSDFTFELENDPSLIAPLCDLVSQMVEGIGLSNAIGRVRIGVAVEQALLNALFHGNLDLSRDQLRTSREAASGGEGVDLVSQRQVEQPYSDRRIFVDASVEPAAVRILIRDEGPGFDITTVPEPSDPASLERTGGRGLVLMRSFMDELTFNDKGNEVVMTKRKDSAAA